MTTLEKIEAQYGKVIAFDGRLAFWTHLFNVIDVRDAAARLRLTRAQVMEAMPEFKPVRRGKSPLETEESE